MMSPGTKSRSGISLAAPSRTTVAVTWIMAFSFSAAASARASCQKRSPTLSTTITAITEPARASPVRKETTDKVVSRITSGLRVILRTRSGQPCFRSCATSFGPVVRARSSASACVKPPRDVRKSRSSFRRPSGRRRGLQEKHEYSASWISLELRARSGEPVARRA